MTDKMEGGGRAVLAGAPAGEAKRLVSSVKKLDAPVTAGRAPMFETSSLEAYRASGMELIALHGHEAIGPKGQRLGKVPRKGWRTSAALTVDEAVEAMEAGTNVGMRLRPTDLVVDVDPRNFAEGDNPLPRLAHAIEIDLDNYPRVVTGSGGLHIYMALPEGFSGVETVEGFDGIEFKQHGRQVVAAGSIHPETGRPYAWWDDPLGVEIGDGAPMAPGKLLTLLERKQASKSVEAGDVTPEQLDEMLEALDPTAFKDHTKWLELMMACHHATGGNGRDEFVAWSTADPEYADDAWVIGRRWDSLHADGEGRRVTQATLFKELVRADRHDLLPRNSAADDFEGVEVEDKSAMAEKSDRPWWEEWVWIATIERFVRRSDLAKFNEKQFKSLHQHLWPDGDICAAVWKGKLPVERFESLAYIPSEAEVIAKGPWAGCYNLWRPSGVAPKPGDVSAFVEHMAYLFPNEREREHVLDYLSMLVSDQFVKIHFALLIQGKPGTGKSFLAKLVRAMIGEANVATPQSCEVVEKYTGWQEGVQLAVLEELMALGRKEVSNTLKPVITDDFLRIRLMHTNVYSTPNFLNLLCITNHRDALPIEAGDRRWLVVFSDSEPRDEAYYDRLFGLLKGDGPAAIKHFLQSRKVGLNPKGVAPVTRGKAEMQKLSLSEPEQYLSDLLNDGAGPFEFDLVRTSDLVEALPKRLQSYRGLQNKLGSWLRDVVGAVDHSRYKKTDGSGRKAWRLWSIRNHEAWEEAGPAARFDAYVEAVVSA
ncbi:DUF5906 domain-containing protein [Sphingomicrobium sp. XHP0235]|uniref:DUF5906 domain-containing protein n=1 Tax=Sphingomicrobium aquimarinum TaxID=3133971 RepID=UPI0031FE898E